MGNLIPKPDIGLRRLFNQQLTQPTFENPADLVAWLGAVQAQDFAAAKWAVGQRLAGATDTLIEQAVSTGAILRTHVLRPTWHFVAPADIRWLLALTAPHVNALNSTYYRKFELDEPLFRRTNAALTKALQGGQQLTRPELVAVLRQAGIEAADLLRFGLIIMRAELDGVICSGTRRGSQITYALLEERVPPVPALEREAALAELARRYFTSHGPATLQDFVWWSGLTAAGARAGLNLAGPLLTGQELEGRTYWFSASEPTPPVIAGALYLLPNYDEYTVAYKDRSAAVDPSLTPKLDARGNFLLNNLIVIDGRVVGTWKRAFAKDAVRLTGEPFRPLNPAENQALTAAAGYYGRFLGLPVTL
jgi:hypothetical protein